MVMKTEPTELHPLGNTRLKPTADMFGVHTMTLRRWWKEGKFPKPIHINGMPFFRNADLLQWISEQEAANDEGA